MKSKISIGIGMVAGFILLTSFFIIINGGFQEDDVLLAVPLIAIAISLVPLMSETKQNQSCNKKIK